MAAAADICEGSVIVNSAPPLVLRVYVHPNFMNLVIPGVFDALGLPSLRRLNLGSLRTLGVLLTEMVFLDDAVVEVEDGDVEEDTRPWRSADLLLGVPTESVLLSDDSSTVKVAKTLARASSYCS